MFKYRVVIRAFTLRRDLAASVLLARLLEREGCEVFIGCVRNFRKVLKYWRPHAVVLNTVSQVRACHRLVPDALIVHWPAEGSEALPTSDATLLNQAQEDYDRLDLLLLWGEFAREQFLQMFPDHDHSKLKVCGNPRLDLVKFNGELGKLRAGASTVGIATRFNSINSASRRMTIFSLQGITNLESVTSQCNYFCAVMETVNYLTAKTDYKISIRPHPLESPQGYRDYIVPHYPGRLEIDESYDFARWAAQQRAIITPSSTSFLESYILGVPMINLDRVAKAHNYVASIQPFTALAADVSRKPESVEELRELLEDGDFPPPRRSEEVDEHLDKAHGWNLPGSAVERAARAIMEAVRTRNVKAAPHIPTSALYFWDWISFNRAKIKEPWHSLLNYERYYHQIPWYYDEIVENILENKKSEISAVGSRSKIVSK